MTTDFEQSEHEKIRAEIAKVREETSRLNSANPWYVFIPVSIWTLAVIWFVKTYL